MCDRSVGKLHNENSISYIFWIVLLFDRVSDGSVVG
jgi:hypothetical protein